MSRKKGTQIARQSAKTKAKVDAVLTGRQAYPTKSGAWKSGNDRFQPSNKSSEVTVLRRDKK